MVRIAVLGSFALLLLVGSFSNADAEATSSRSDVTQIQKVIEMLGNLMAKGKQEKHEEEVMMAEFKANCEATQKAMIKAIDTAAAAIEQLKADILAAQADVDRLSEEIAALEAEVATAEGDLKAATAVREKEKADFMAANADYAEFIDALARAIAVLKSRSADVAQEEEVVETTPKPKVHYEEGLLQKSASAPRGHSAGGAFTLEQLVNGKIPGIPKKVQAVVDSFLAVDPEGTSLLEIEAPEANAYESQSGGVVEMLEKLKLKFEDEKLALEKAEMNAQASYDMLAQSLHDQIEAGNDGIDKKTEQKGQRTADGAAAKGELEETSVQKAEDGKIFSDSLAECRAKAEEYEKNQVTRMEEIQAITKAIEIMSSPEVSGSAEKHLPQLVQTSGASLAKRAVRQAMVLTETRATEEQLKLFNSFLQTGAAPHSRGVDKQGSVAIDLPKSLETSFEKQKVELAKEEPEDKIFPLVQDRSSCLTDVLGVAVWLEGKECKEAPAKQHSPQKLTGLAPILGLES